MTSILQNHLYFQDLYKLYILIGLLISIVFRLWKTRLNWKNILKRNILETINEIYLIKAWRHAGRWSLTQDLLKRLKCLNATNIKNSFISCSFKLCQFKHSKKAESKKGREPRNQAPWKVSTFIFEDDFMFDNSITVCKTRSILPVVMI